MTIDTMLRELARHRRTMIMNDAEHYATARSPIRYAAHENSDHDKTVSLGVAQANRQLGTPVFCVHGKLARIQCKKCG